MKASPVHPVGLLTFSLCWHMLEGKMFLLIKGGDGRNNASLVLILVGNELNNVVRALHIACLGMPGAGWRGVEHFEGAVKGVGTHGGYIN